ncbi:hypothetical protein HPB47_005465 [Ixodes persulcatus]|uniref:Uncharacterized protein n=1 Tax=Ixodes persulcatus TaxID=34615 RepID=A0AC60PDB6_IXOPE|nr:hypothetical protein HPB47_005465 [Ixodes persulcatus]
MLQAIGANRRPCEVRVSEDRDVERGVMAIGSWSNESGLKITRTASMVQEEIMETLQNKTFKITTLINAPYVMLKESASRLSGNDRFEGFCVDLVREMSRLLGFRYQLRLVRDGSYGTRNRDGRWNGMLRELIDRKYRTTLNAGWHSASENRTELSTEAIQAAGSKTCLSWTQFLRFP